MLKEKERFFRYIFTVIDFIVSIGSFHIGIFFRNYLPFGGDFDGFEPFYYILISIIIGMIQIWIFRATRFYRTRRGERVIKEFWEIIQGVSIAYVFLIAILFFFREFSFSRLVFAYGHLTTILLLIITHTLLRAYLKSIRKKGKNLRYIVIVGNPYLNRKLVQEVISEPEMGYRIIGLVETNLEDVPFAGKKAEIKNETHKSQKFLNSAFADIKKLSWLKFKEIIEKWQVDSVIITLSSSEEDYIFKIMDLCKKENIDVRIIPSEIGLLELPWRLESFFGFPVINFGQAPLDSVGSRNSKRAFDMVFSFFVIILLLPFFIIISLLVKISSRGPIFFVQERVGLDNRPIMVYKFRTMELQKPRDSDTIWTVEKDPRRTKIGAFLRKTNLDELPQFFNVLKGEMSVVGPRPERLFFVKKFKAEIPDYMLRHQVKAGITGWAQINGLRGDTSIAKRVEADLWYIENWSLWLDIKIIILTLIKAMFDKNAY